MQENSILKIGVFYIIIFLMLLNIVGVLNSLFVALNSYLVIESQALIVIAHILLAVIAVAIFIGIYNKFLKAKEPSMTTIIVSFAGLIIFAIVNLVVSSLGALTLLQVSKVVYSMHQSASMLSSLIVMPLGFFVFFMVKIAKRN